jgi:hypothetical protein
LSSPYLIPELVSYGAVGVVKPDGVGAGERA